MREVEPPMAGSSQTAPDDRRGGSGRNDRPDPATDAFVAHRDLLFTVGLLGSAADAEDVLQEAWLKWAGVDLGTVQDQRAYLVRITTRQALTQLRTLRRLGSPTSAPGSESRVLVAYGPIT